MYCSEKPLRFICDVIPITQCRICYNFVTVISLMSLKKTYLNKKKTKTVYQQGHSFFVFLCYLWLSCENDLLMQGVVNQNE